MSEQSLRPLEELFRARVLALVVEEGLLDRGAAGNMLGWRHNGHRISQKRGWRPETGGCR